MGLSAETENDQRSACNGTANCSEIGFMRKFTSTRQEFGVLLASKTGCIHINVKDAICRRDTAV